MTESSQQPSGRFERIVLIGLSYSGKSTLGPVLAKILGWDFVDTDLEFERVYGKSPAHAIETLGEPAFREQETVIIKTLSENSKCVISTGGGAFSSPENRKHLSDNGFIVHLDAPVDVLYERYLADDSGEVRPILEQSDNPIDSLRTLESRRRSTYLLADLTLPTIIEDVHAPLNELTRIAGRIISVWAQSDPDIASRTNHFVSEDVSRMPAAIVGTSDKTYPVWVGVGELSRLTERLAQLNLAEKRVFIIGDEAVMALHGNTVTHQLQLAQIPGASYLIPPGEQSKNYHLLGEVYSWLADQKAERGDLIIGFGGGVATDIAGYVAATYLRGLSVLLIPTSTLAMNDAAIGGKTGIDLPQGKNLVGAFKQPSGVIVDVELLRTLPKRSYVEGFAEIIKHGLILDSELFEWLEENSAELLRESPDLNLLAKITARSVRLKSMIVSADPHESGLRAILNYGHTTGHAIETVTSYEQYMHGEAVSVGMMAAGYIGRDLGRTPQELLERQSDVLRTYGLPVSAPGLNPTAVLEAMTRDKKVVRGDIRFVLIDKVGHAFLEDSIPIELIKDNLKRITK